MRVGTFEKTVLSVVLGLALAAPLLAQPGPGTCEPGTALKDLNINDVQARLFNTGSLFYSPSSSAIYRVPQESGNSAIFAAGLWAGGKVDGELRVAGARYVTFEFWPGPLDADGRPPSDCTAYDRLFKVGRPDLANFAATGEPSPDLADWPVHLGAPVLDGDGIPDNYDLAAGDEPAIWGDQTVFWVMNDVGNAHRETGSDPIGLEVRVTAFAKRSANRAIDQATLYRYEVEYVGEGPGSAPLEDAYLSFFADTDLGGATDDRAGIDTTLNMAFVYNGDNADSQFGVAPPAVGFLLFERAGAFVSLDYGPIGSIDPGTAEQYYNFMQGRWRDGMLITEQGTGYKTGGGPVTQYTFAGDPVTGQCWSEVNPATPQPDGSCVPAAAEPLSDDDRRMVVSTKAFRLEPGQTKVFEFAIVFGRGEDNIDSVAELRNAARTVTAAYRTGRYDPRRTNDLPTPPPLPERLGFAVVPNPVTARLTVRLALPQALPVAVEVFDVLGRRVAAVAERELEAGERSFGLDAAGLVPGVYVARVRAGDAEATRTFTVLR